MANFRLPIVILSAVVTLFSVIQLGVAAAARAQQPSYYRFSGYYYSRYYSYGSGVYAAPALLIVSSLFNMCIGAICLVFAVMGLKRDGAQFGAKQKLVGAILTAGAALSLIFAIAGSAKWGADGWLSSYTHTRNAAVAFGIITSLAAVALSVLILLGHSSDLPNDKLESGHAAVPAASSAPIQQQQPQQHYAAPAAQAQQHYASPMMSQADSQPNAAPVAMPQAQPATVPMPQAPAHAASRSTGAAEDPSAMGNAQGWTSSS